MKQKQQRGGCLWQQQVLFQLQPQLRPVSLAVTPKKLVAKVRPQPHRSLKLQRIEVMIKLWHAISL